MISFDPKNYIDKQKERFDTLLNVAPKAISLKNDIDYLFKSTHNSISDELNQMSEIDKFFSVTISEQTKTYNQLYKKIKQEFDQTIIHIEQTLLDEKDSLKRQEIKNNYDSPNQLLILNQEINEKTARLFELINHMSNVKTKKIKTIEHKIEKQRQHYKKQIGLIESEKTQSLKSKLADYEDALSLSHKKNHDRMLALTLKQNELQTDKKLELKKYDEDIITIKTAFNRLITRLNDSIKSVQRKFLKETKNYEDTISIEISNVEKIILKLKQALQEETRQVTDAFGDELVFFGNKIDDLRASFNVAKDDITKSYTRDITLNNAKLASFKEQNLANLEILEDKATKTRNSLDNTAPDYRLNLATTNKSLKRDRKKLENDLIVVLNETKSKNITRKKQYQTELIQNEVYFVKKLELYRYKRNIKEMKKNHQIYLINQQYDLKIKVLVNQRIRLEHSLLSMNQVIKEKQMIAIQPYDTQVNLARHIHDLETNFCSSEHGYEKQVFFYRKAKYETKDAMDDASIKHQRNLVNITYHYVVKNVKIEKYLEIEYEKNKLVGDKKINEVKKQLVDLEFQRNELSLRHQFALEKEKLLSAQKEISFNQRITAQKLEVTEQIYVLNHDNQMELEKLDFNHLVSVNKAKRIITSAMYEIQKQRKVIDLFFKVVSHIQTEQESLYFTVRDLYQITDIETFASAKNELLEILESQLISKNNIAEALKVALTEFFKEKINELTAFKYMSLKKDIVEEYDSTHKYYLNEIKKLDDQIRELRNQSADLYQEIAISENQISDVIKTKEIIRKQILSLRTSPDKQRRKTIKNLTLELQTLSKEIVKYKNDISHIRLQIDQIKHRMKHTQKGYKPIQSMILKTEKTRISRENNLNKSQYLEGRIYYDAIKMLNQLVLSYTNHHKKMYTHISDSFNRFESTDFSEKGYKVFIKSLMNVITQQKLTTNKFHTSFIHVLDNQFSHVKTEQERIIKDYSQTFDLSKNSLIHDLKSREKKLHAKQIELNKYQRSYKKIQEKHLSNSIKMAKVHYKQKDTQLRLQIKSFEHVLATVQLEKINILEATKENTSAVISSNLNLLKQEIKTLESANHIFQKEKNSAITELDKDHLAQSERYISQEKHYALIDKQVRKELNLKLNEELNMHKNTITALQQKHNNLIKTNLRNEHYQSYLNIFNIKKSNFIFFFDKIAEKMKMKYKILKDAHKIKRK